MVFCGCGFFGGGEEKLRGRAQGHGLLARYTTHREAVVAVIVIGRVDIAAIVIQVVGVRSAVGTARPEVAVRRRIVERATIEVARAREILGARTKQQVTRRVFRQLMLRFPLEGDEEWGTLGG